jgi:dipeptidyl aminopeptidase/acylaminoacyl peptidase
MPVSIYRIFVLLLITFALLGLYSCSKDRPDLTALPVELDSSTPSTVTDNPTQIITTPNPTFELGIPQNQDPSDVNLLIVYEKSGNLWVSERGIISQLTSGEKDSQPTISDDGKRVAFRRGEELWAIDNSGQNERKLFGELGLAPLQFDFSPGGHNIFFTTKTSDEKPRYDLNIFDLDHGEFRTLLTEGEGGVFTPAPNWESFALVQPGKIIAYNPSEGTTQLLYQFQSVTSESKVFLPPIAWLENGFGFKTIIPNQDGKTFRFLFISAKVGKPAQLAEFSAVPFTVSNYFISPDGSRVLYLKEQGEDLELHVIDASTTDSIYLRKPRGKLGIIGWSLNSKNILIWLDKPDSVWIFSNKSISSFSDTTSVTLISSVNSNNYLFKSETELRLMMVGKQSSVIDSGVTGSFDARILY